jgi:gliding motility-associated-like protein
LDQGQISDEDKGFFVLHTSATDSLGEVLFINTNGNFDASGLVLDSTYFISFVSGDSLLSGDLDLLDPCLSVSIGQPIIYYSTPSLFAGDNIAVCGLEIILNGFIDNNDSIEWNILDQPTGSNPIINDKNDINTSLSTDIPGDYQIRLSNFSGNCISLDTVLVTFYDELQVEIVETECSINNDFYTVSFNIMGGVAPYLVDGIETNGMNFTSSPIPSNTSYSFEIGDNSPCSQLILEGIKDCSCPSQPGQLDNELIELCAGENFIINYVITPVLDSGYEAVFVLHNGTNSTIGDVFQIINGSLLVFDGTIPLNQSLLLSPLVGPLNGQGIDFNDSCTLLGQGTPIIWYENIDIQLQTPSTVCIDEFFDIEIQINSPFYPLNIILSGPGINQPLVVGSNQPLSFELSINTSGKFEILGVDNECIGISSILSSDIEVENCDCEVYSFNSLDSICVTQNLIDLTLWNFQNAQGDWSINSFTGQNSPKLSDTVLDLTSSTSGILNLSFTPSSELSCDSVYLFDLYIEAPVNTSLVENYINFCNSDTDIIDLNNYLINGQVGEWVGYTSLPMEVFFEGKINLNLLSPGIYDFEYLTNQSNGICNNDQLILTVEITEELEYVLTTFDPICFGETGGFFIDILNSSVDISNVTLNGESLDFLGNSELIAGNYNLIITDINECQSFENFEINQSSELLINLQSSNINNNVTVFASFNKPAANLDLSWFVNNEELGSQNDLKLELSITEDTEVILEAVDQNGCIKRESVFVPYEIELFVNEIVFPNIFNPTSGAGNNIFSIPENESISIVESFQIFDRWGQIIFEASNYSPIETTIGWDGKKGSENASEGVYVFYLKYFNNNGDIKIHAGDITLIR